MAHGTAVGKVHLTNKVLSCPRDKSLMVEQEVGEACLDICQKCGGQFFDAGEMFASFGMKADPSNWDRAETGGAVKAGEVKCPRCEHMMRAQDVSYESHKVEIDRCVHCHGIWLDKGEIDTIIAIGEKMQPILEAEKAKAKAELDAMGDVSFASPGLIARFLGLFSKKKS